MERRSFLKRLGILAGASLIPDWFGKKNPAEPETFDEASVYFTRDRSGKYDYTIVLINGKFYEQFPDGTSDSDIIKKGKLWMDIAQNKNHPHNKDIDLVEFAKNQIAARKRGEELIRKI